VWEEIFKQDESNWPSVVFLVTGWGAKQFKFEHHVRPFVANLPPSWQGTLVLGDFEFSGRGGGLVTMEHYEFYVKEITALVKSLNDPRVRWIDGNGISKEMRMYSQKGEDYVARSQHFHHPCMRKDEYKRNEAMVTCSNITEMMGQLLLGHALGPKQEFVERVKQSKSSSASKMRWCHACPKCMLPFHLTPFPKMECVDGPIQRNTENANCEVMRENRGHLQDDEQSNDPLLCPASCLESPVTSEFGSESDTIYVRQCPVEQVSF